MAKKESKEQQWVVEIIRPRACFVINKTAHPMSSLSAGLQTECEHAIDSMNKRHKTIHSLIHAISREISFVHVTMLKINK